MRELAEGEIYFDKMCSTLDKDGDISGFYVNPKEISRAVGINKTNKLRIKEKYGKEIKIKPMESLKKGEISVWKE